MLISQPPLVSLQTYGGGHVIVDVYNPTGVRFGDLVEATSRYRTTETEVQLPDSWFPGMPPPAYTFGLVFEGPRLSSEEFDEECVNCKKCEREGRGECICVALFEEKVGLA